MKTQMKVLACFILCLFLFSSLFEIAEAGKDYYKILGVTRKADVKEIKKEFKKLSRQYHPDKSNDPNAKEKFVEIAEGWFGSFPPIFPSFGGY